MAFLETPRLPDIIARGLTCGPSFSTRVVTLRSGAEQRNANWSRSRWRADAASAVRKMTEFAALEEFFYAVGGRLHGFRVRDYADFRHSDAGGAAALIAIDANGYVLSGASAGYGYGVASHQMIKQYAAGALAHNRWITKPAASGVVITRAGTPVAAGTDPGQVAIDSTTGRVTFVADQTRAISSHTPGSNHVLTLASAFSPNVSITGRVYVSGCGGADASLINGRSHVVTNLSGDDVTIALDTVGKTITGGNAFLYPQPNQTLAWTGEFDVPCRFDVDQLDRNMITRQLSGDYLVQALSIPLVEVRDA